MVGVGGIKNPHRPQAGRKSSLSLSCASQVLPVSGSVLNPSHQVTWEQL